MNILVYILLAAFVVYVLYKLYFKSGSRNAASSEMLNLSSEQPKITTVVKPGAANYTYSMWLYLNRWAEGDKIVFEATNGTQTMQQLSFDKSSAKLVFSARRKSGTATGLDAITITDTFPLQKWVHVVIVAFNQNVDFYIDGKMRSSVTLSGQPELNTTTIGFGSGFDCYVSKFYRAVDTNIRAPVEVEREYLAGNGSRILAQTGNVHGEVRIEQDGDVLTKIPFF